MSRVDSANPTLNALAVAVFHLDLYKHIAPLTVLVCVVRDVNLRSVIHWHKLLFWTCARFTEQTVILEAWEPGSWANRVDFV